jgi:hypothetical protein
MDAKAVVEHFGGVTATARALDVKPPSVSEWLSTGIVPELRQFQIEVVTQGKFRADTPTVSSNEAA